MRSESVQGPATFGNPFQYPTGIDHILIAGHWGAKRRNNTPGEGRHTPYGTGIWSGLLQSLEIGDEDSQSLKNVIVCEYLVVVGCLVHGIESL